jgi:hypothetical protein
VKPRRSVTEASSQCSREPTPSRPQLIVRQVDHKPRPTTGRLRSDRYGEVLRSDEPQICSVLIASLDPVRVGANAVSSGNPSQARNQCARSAMEARTERQRLFSIWRLPKRKQISKSPVTRARPLREGQRWVQFWVRSRTLGRLPRRRITGIHDVCSPATLRFFFGESLDAKSQNSSEIGSSGWTRTSNPPVNRLMQVLFLDGSSLV